MVETISYTIGRQAIQIPVDHPLPRFQESLELYERFPFFLATACDRGEWIIDVGANIGDTTTAFIQATEGSVLAIEGQNRHFQLLRANVEGLSPGLRARIAIVNTFERIDNVLAENGIAAGSVTVLKTGTDGRNAGFLASAASLLVAGSPILYCKNQFEDETQLLQCENLYAALEQMGYRTFWIIDNFGNPLVDQVPPSCLSSLIDYLRAGLSGRTLRTIEYYDIVACKDDRIALVDQVVSNFRAFVNMDEAATAVAYHCRP